MLGHKQKLLGHVPGFAGAWLRHWHRGTTRTQTLTCTHTHDTSTHTHTYHTSTHAHTCTHTRHIHTHICTHTRLFHTHTHASTQRDNTHTCTNTQVKDTSIHTEISPACWWRMSDKYKWCSINFIGSILVLGELNVKFQDFIALSVAFCSVLLIDTSSCKQ